jgi:hypothetical protein
VISKYMNEILGSENIYRLPHDIEGITDISKIPLLPSPDRMQNKYVIKCKTARIIPQVWKESTFNKSDTQFGIEESKVQDGIS